jgi:hypothetical protein
MATPKPENGVMPAPRPWLKAGREFVAYGWDAHANPDCR